MKVEARLYEKLEDNKVRCNVCARRCIIPEGKRGNCMTRKNEKGTLYTLIYASLISRGAIDPVEKKPLYHYWPGHEIFSIATVGCSFHCRHCQNWDISQCYPDEEGKNAICRDIGYRGATYPLYTIGPEELVKMVKKSGCNLIAYTYNEPLIWHEYIMDVATLAKKEGIGNVLVTNGYSTPEASEELVKVMDAANIDIKAFNNDFYRRIVGVPDFKPVLDTAVYWKKHGMHIEITNLIIPEENDNMDEIREMCIWIRENLGKETPVHFSAYHPDYKLTQHHTTPVSTLENAYNVAKEEGLYYVFLGNVLSPHGNNTVCPECGKVLIKRKGYTVGEVNLTDDNKCPACGFETGIVGKSKTRRGFWF